jgi:acyl dehydratase
MPGGIIGATAGPTAHAIDARWLMAYAAALGDTAPEYLDTARPGGIVGHPLFPVCYEWPLALDLRARTMPEDIALRSVHATHDLRLYRRARPGDHLHTTATVVAAEPRRPGAYLVSRFETVDAEGHPVSTTDYGSIYRGVTVDGPAPLQARGTGQREGLRGAGARGEGLQGGPPGAGPAVDVRSARPAEAPFPADWSASVPISPTLAHVYTECARIWNPIHTDRAVALAAGLPDIILHGTATLALAVSTILRQEALGADAPVTGIRCRFSGMVPLAGSIEVLARRMRDAGPAHRGHAGSDRSTIAPARRRPDRVIDFCVRAPDGRLAIRDGCVRLGHVPEENAP